MACIKSAARSAVASFSWEGAYLAAGTMAGALDGSFSSTANLDIFRLDFHSDSVDLPLAATAPSLDRFCRLSWSRPSGYSLGLIAGGLSDGTIGVWDPKALLSSPGEAENSMVATLEKLTGPVRGLEFNALLPHSLASGADDGELYIWDLNDPSKPVVYPPLKTVGSAAQTELSYVSWNPKFSHIVASTSQNGVTVVWDLNQQKPLTSFSDSNRRRCSVLQWNPDISTQLIIASDDDNSPSLRVWDVRKTISPFKEFVGHSKGVIGMSWCPYDSSYLLTCAKDNRTICWDTHSGEMLCELPASNNWNFDVHWYPKIPGVISASSYDVRIGIYNIEACGRYVGEGSLGTPARLRAPKWLKCPTGASFGFGGKFVSFHPSLAAPNQPSASPAHAAQNGKSEVYVHDLVIEHSLVSRSNDFEAAIQNKDKTALRALCDKKSQESMSEEDKETWGFLKVMFEEDGTARTKLLSHLGFEVPEEEAANEADQLGQSFAGSLSLNVPHSDGGDGQFLVDSGDDFFNNPQPAASDVSLADETNSNNKKQGHDEHGEQVVVSDPSADESIQRLLIVGDYKGAVKQCIAANRMADALVIAHIGGVALWESTRNQYLKSSMSPYLKVVSAIVNNDLGTLVNTWPLSQWKEILVLLCTLAQKEEWAVLCDNLASRLSTIGNTRAATLCYICAGNIDKAVEIWALKLKSSDDGRTYVDLLQDLMEKTIALVLASGHTQFSASLCKLVENYAELLASQGQLKTALEYLNLLGSAESSPELAVLRERIALSTEVDVGFNSSDPYGIAQQTDSYYAQTQLNFGTTERSQQINQVQQQISNTPYTQYPAAQQKAVFQDYSSTVTSLQQAPSMQMFYPSQSPQTHQPSFVPQPISQPPVKSFVPTSVPDLKNAEHYQQPTLGSQLYPAAASPYQTAPTVPAPHGVGTFPGTVAGHRFPQGVANNPPARFMPSPMPPTQSFTPRPSLSPLQPSSPTQHPPQPAVVPPAPAPTVQTVDTSNVPMELRPVIVSLTRLYDETTKALGGQQANVSKRREIEDNSKRIGALFAKLNGNDVSSNVKSKLIQLCHALNNKEYASALHLQLQLTTSDWDECDFWLVALKRMIKLREKLE